MKGSINIDFPRLTFYFYVAGCEYDVQWPACEGVGEQSWQASIIWPLIVAHIFLNET